MAQMSVTMMAATLLRHFRFDAIHPNTPAIPCGYDITVCTAEHCKTPRESSAMCFGTAT